MKKLHLAETAVKQEKLNITPPKNSVFIQAKKEPIYTMGVVLTDIIWWKWLLRERVWYVAFESCMINPNGFALR